jgi:GTP pyrophosphokinase
MEYNKLVNDLYNELMHRVKMYIKDSKKIYLIERAFSCAFEGHKDKKRHSGEPYIVHPLCVALILSKTPLIKDANIIAACLLHDVVEDCGITVEELRLHFNDDVAMLVDGVSKISREELPHTTKEERDDINKAKILMSMIKDIRVMYIKLADRLHNSRTFMYLPYDKQIEMLMKH